MTGGILQGIKTLGDLAAGKADPAAVGEDAAENVRRGFEHVAEDFQPENIQEKVRDFFSRTGVDIDDGIKKAADFFGSLGTPREEKKEETPTQDEPDDAD